MLLHTGMGVAGSGAGSRQDWGSVPVGHGPVPKTSGTAPDVRVGRGRCAGCVARPPPAELGRSQHL